MVPVFQSFAPLSLRFYLHYNLKVLIRYITLHFKLRLIPNLINLALSAGIIWLLAIIIRVNKSAKQSKDDPSAD